MKRKILLSFTLAVLAWMSTPAQEAVVPAGNYHEGNARSISWTLGEMAIETLVSDTYILTQGFQQGTLLIVSVDPLPDGTDIVAYPNPTRDYLYVDFRGEPAEDVSYSIHDLTGRLMASDRLDPDDTVIPFSAYQGGTYILRIISGNDVLTTITVLKK